MRLLRAIVAAVPLLVVTGTVAGAETEIGTTLAAPTPDEPPVETRSPEVKASRDPKLPPALGPNPSKVCVVLFCDFQDAECHRLARAMRQIPEQWPGDVRLEFRQLPSAADRRAENAAVASLAAHRQGKFWPMYDCLFAQQKPLDDDTLTTCARRSGLDLKRYAKDYADTALRDRVRAEVLLANRLGVRRAPAYTVNGRLYLGWGGWDVLRGGVELERTRVDALLAKGTKLPAIHVLRATDHARDLEAYEAVVKHLLPRVATARKH